MLRRDVQNLFIYDRVPFGWLPWYNVDPEQWGGQYRQKVDISELTDFQVLQQVIKSILKCLDKPARPSVGQVARDFQLVEMELQNFLVHPSDAELVLGMAIAEQDVFIHEDIPIGTVILLPEPYLLGVVSETVDGRGTLLFNPKGVLWVQLPIPCISV